MSDITLIQNFTLPGEIHRKFALDWSQDNKISVCTSKAIYILTSYCSPFETDFPLPLHKQVITVPENVLILQPLKMPCNPYHLIESVEDENNVHQILMDHTLNPFPPERAENFRSFRCAKWSPKGAAKGGRCILAALTFDHRLVLYEEINKEWVSICDITEVLKAESDEIKKISQLSEKMNKGSISVHKDKKIIESNVKTRRKCVLESSGLEIDDLVYSDIFDFKTMKDRTYKFAPIEITWTSMFGSPASTLNENSSEYCFLIVAMKSGHIQFWRISSNESRFLSLAHEWDTGLGLLTSICWQQTSPTAGFLMCGTLKGVFAFLPVTLHSDAEQEPVIAVKEMCKVWDEEDHVSVEHIAVLKIALKKYVIVAAKQHALIACEIVLTDSSIIIKNVGHSFGLHRLPVTGMTVMDTTMPQYRLLIATMEGLFVEIKISLKDDEINFQHEKLNIDLDLRNMMVQGLAVSSNGLLCSVLLKTAVYYDHLEKREALQFAMFITKPFEEIYQKFKTVLKPAFSFLPTASSSIVRHIDFLECIRINLACGSSLPDWMTAFLSQDISTLQNVFDLELYTRRFVLQCHVSGLATSSPVNTESLEKRLRDVEHLIMRNHISKVFGSCQDKLDLLTPAQGQSLLLMADWLLKEFSMSVDNLYSALGCEIPSSAESLPARETCRICKNEVKLDNIKSGQCSNKHMFGRCCQSLLLCDVIPYHQCSSCKSVALQDVWSFGLVCTYCGMNMT